MYRPLNKNWFVLIFARPGNCKSIEQARMSYYLLKEYDYTIKKYPELPDRFLFTNQILNSEIFSKWIGREQLRYWDKPEDFRYCPRVSCWKTKEKHRLHDCDLMIDEGATLFPADKFADTPLWLRKLWAQHRHNGVRILMLTQDFKNIDINCRRMIWKSYQMKKVIGSRDISPTLPALSKWSLRNLINPRKSVIWGVYTKQEIDLVLIENDPEIILKLRLSGDTDAKLKELEEAELIGWPEIHFITWWKCNLYDTTQDVKEFKVTREYEHIEGKCTDPFCDYEHVTHKLK